MDVLAALSNRQNHGNFRVENVREIVKIIGGQVGVKVKDKACKRKKCPYYNENYRLCNICEWNPDGVWMKER